MEDKAFAGIVIFALVVFLHSHNILLLAATRPLYVSSGGSLVHNRKLLEYGEIQDYDSPRPNRRHDPPTPTPESSTEKQDGDGNNKKKLKLMEVVEPSRTYDYGQPGSNPHHGLHSSPVTARGPRPAGRPDEFQI